MPILLSVLGHHSEPGDPVLLDWLLHLFYSVVGLGTARYRHRARRHYRNYPRS